MGSLRLIFDAFGNHRNVERARGIKQTPDHGGACAFGSEAVDQHLVDFNLKFPADFASYRFTSRSYPEVLVRLLSTFGMI